MKRNEKIAKRFREVILNGSLIANTNYKNQLENLNFKIATEKIDQLNTISTLAQHIHYYISGVLKVFNGGTLNIKDKFSFDFPLITTNTEWKSFLSKFWKDANKFANFIDQLSDKDLNKNFVDKKYGTYEHNLNVMIEHSYYHLGQIVLLEKLIRKI